MKYRFEGKEKELVLGVSPEISLASDGTKRENCWRTVQTPAW
jgi:hypothetical protein